MLMAYSTFANALKSKCRFFSRFFHVPCTQQQQHWRQMEIEVYSSTTLRNVVVCPIYHVFVDLSDICTLQSCYQPSSVEMLRQKQTIFLQFYHPPSKEKFSESQLLGLSFVLCIWLRNMLPPNHLRLRHV